MEGKLLVEHTNDWSIDSKRSMVDLGYFQDEFIHLFSGKKRRTPLINLCYYVRSYIMDRSLRNLQRINSSKYQVISLGAGFDTSYFRIFANDPNVKFVEIDLPCVVKKKVDIILNNDITNKFLKNCTIENEDKESNFTLISDNYVILSQNLDNTAELNVRLQSVGIDYRIPTIILSEIAITYMDEKSCTQLCKFLSEKFINSVFLVYEQINPDDGFGRFMMQHFETIQSPLKALTRYNEVSDNQANFYKKNGWDECSMFRVLDFYLNIAPMNEFLSKIQLEPVCEWEEFHLTCLHYALYIASNGMMTDIALSFNQNPTPFIQNIRDSSWAVVDVNSFVERFSHNVIVLNPNRLVVFGGVGIENNCHRKCSTFQIINLENREIINSENSFSQFAMTHMASCLVEVKNFEAECFLIYGGCKSPNREGDPNPYMIHYGPPSSFSVEKIDIEEDSSRPCHRWRHSLVSFQSNIYMYGGRTHDMMILDDLWSLTVTRTETGWCGKWSLLSSEGPLGRFAHSCAVTDDGCFYISGGLDSHLQPLDDVWLWDSSNGWSNIEVQDSIARYGHTSHVFQDRLILIGGVTYHPSNPTVTIIHSNGSAYHYSLVNSPAHPLMVHSHQSVVLREREILIIGGGGNCFSFGTFFNKHIVKLPAFTYLLKSVP